MIKPGSRKLTLVGFGVIAALAAITLFMAISTVRLQPVSFIPEFYFWKLGHIAAFAAIGGTLSLMMPKRVMAILLICAVFGILTEAAQFISADHTPSPIDVGIDIVGAFIGFTAANRLKQITKSK